MKKCFFFILAFISLNTVFLPGCSSKNINDEGIRIVEQDAVQYKETSLNDEELFNTLLSKEPTMLQMQQSLEDISFKQLGVMYYTIVKTSQNLYLVWFDETEKYCFYRIIVFSDIESKTKIDRINKGDELDSVMQADPQGGYDFLYASWSGFPQISYHFFEDGSAYEILYEDGIVSRIIVFII